MFVVGLNILVTVLVSLELAVQVISVMLWLSWLITSDVLTVISLGMQTLSELLVIIKGKALCVMWFC